MLNVLKTIRFVHWAWVVPILLLTTVLIFTHLTSDAYWADEGSTLRNIGAPPYPERSVQDLIFHVGLSEWPPAYFLSVLGWAQVVGWSELATRYLGLLMGVASVALIYRLGKDMYGSQVGIVASLLLGTSTVFVFYSHELRGYILYILLTISSIYLYWHSINHSELTYRKLVGFIMSYILLIYTHYMAICVFAAVGLYHIIFGRKQNHWGKIFFGFIVITLAYLPWLGISVINILEVSSWDGGKTAQVLLETLINIVSNTLWFVALPLLITSFVFCRTRETKLLWFVLLVSTSIILTANVISPFIFSFRHLISALPFIILLVAVGLNHLPYKSNIITLFVLLAWVILGVWLNRNLDFIQSNSGSSPSVSIETMHSARDIVNLCVRPNDTVVTMLTRGNSNWDEHVIVPYLADATSSFNLAIILYMTHIDTSHPPIDSTTPFETRFQNLTENSARTWVLIGSLARPRTELTELGALLTDKYESCGQIISTPFIKGYLYQNDSEFTCDVPTVDAERSLSNCSSNLLQPALEAEGK